MSTFLIRDDDSSTGVKVLAGNLPRTREESYVPWALATDGRVVYARSDQYRNRATKGGLRPYDSLISQDRRRLAQTALGSLALRNPQWYMASMQMVSVGAKRYLAGALFSQPGIRERYMAMVGKYMYGTAKMSFGRLSDVVPTGPNAALDIWLEAIKTLDSCTPVASAMSIHDGAGKMLLPGDRQKVAYDQRLNQLRPALPGEIMDPGARGRENVPAAQFQSTTSPGIVSRENAGKFPQIQDHNRGVDMFRRTVPRYSPQTPIPTTVSKPELSGVSYYRDLDTRNELFGAGPSGTTGTLLAACAAFAGLSGELLRQYVLAIIAYLVGGGMHSLHESLSVVRLLGGEFQYNSGSMLGYSKVDDIRSVAKSDAFPALPDTFKNSSQFAKWRDEYYDIVVLGGLHWMFNAR